MHKLSLGQLDTHKSSSAVELTPLIQFYDACLQRRSFLNSRSVFLLKMAWAQFCLCWFSPYKYSTNDLSAILLPAEVECALGETPEGFKLVREVDEKVLNYTWNYMVFSAS